MPRYILHHDGLFFEWSTVVDAPVSPAMTREEFVRYWGDLHGNIGLRDLPERLERAVASGCSAHRRMSAEECIAGNRAGEGETNLPFAEVIAQVKRERPDFGLPPL